MPQYQAIGSGPIAFLDGNSSQLEMPLNFVYFDTAGVHASTAWPPYANNASVVDALLSQLANQGVLFAGTTPISPPAPALTVTAVQPGALGNSITVGFVNPSTTSTANSVDITVTVAEVFPLLNEGNIATTLGTAAGTGLVFFPGAFNGAPAAASNLASNAEGVVTIPEAANAADTAFTLQAVPGILTSGTPLTVNVVPDPAPATTFTLQVNWTMTAKGLVPSAIEGENNAANPFAFLVTFIGTGTGGLPESGTVALQGGAPPSTATQAAASVISA